MEERDPIYDLIGFVVSIIGLSLALAMCTSCGTKRYITREVPVVVTETTHDTLRETRYIHTSDTTYIRDSIAVNDKGGIDRWHSEYGRSREKIHDTLYVNKYIEKPIPYEVTKEVPVEVEKKRSWLEQLRDGLGWMVIGTIVCLVAKIYVKRKG